MHEVTGRNLANPMIEVVSDCPGSFWLV